MPVLFPFRKKIDGSKHMPFAWTINVRVFYEISAAIITDLQAHSRFLLHIAEWYGHWKTFPHWLY